ncbi:ThiF family adenylyltransferase [Anaerotruncus rubiinfantis]|uniref:ThiF family adenylyltransferase n=1 Tax=Anaerotruncus rubiinfantis TaxID=1720200 RepID=UPI003D799808
MKFSQQRPVRVIMIGAGGTGGHIAPHLYRMLHTLDRPCRYIIIDGDIVEGKNLIRQNFIPADLGRNKAQVLAERYSAAFGMECEFIPEYMESEERLTSLVRPRYIQNGVGFNHGQMYVDAFHELVILIGCVDNNKSRQLCDRVFRQVTPLVYIDAGNGEHTGQVVCGIRAGKRTVFKPIASLYPDILEDEDMYPSELSCEEMAISSPQSIVANLTAATAVVNYVYNIVVRGELHTRAVHFSTTNLNVRPDLVAIRRKKAA